MAKMPQSKANAHSAAQKRPGRAPSHEQAKPAHSPDLTESHHSTEALHGDSFGQAAFERHVALLSDSRLSHPMHARQRALVVQQLQRDYGNRYVQRLMDHVMLRRAEASQNEVAHRAIQVRPLRAKAVQRWKVETFEKNKAKEFGELLAKMDGSTEPEKRKRMSALAELTQSPQELSELLDATSGPSKSLTLLSLLSKLGGSQVLEGLKALSPDPAVIAKCIELEPEPLNRRDLLELHAQLKDVNLLIQMLSSIKSKQKSADILDALKRAGGLDGLKKLEPLSKDIGTLVMLLRKPGIESGEKLQEFIPIAKDGETLLELLDVGDAATVKSIMSEASNNKADLSKLKPLVAMAVVTKNEATVSTKPLRFTQDTVTNQGDKYTVKGNIENLKKDKNWHIPGPPIRVFQKKSSMNAWGKNQNGDPKNLEDGMIYTLDNRRLYAYRVANRKIPKPTLVPDNVVKPESWKFTTKNRGESAKLV